MNTFGLHTAALDKKLKNWVQLFVLTEHDGMRTKLWKKFFVLAKKNKKQPKYLIKIANFN